MSAVVIVLIVVVVLVVLMFAGGAIAAGRRSRLGAGDYERHLTEADQALEQARAADKGWDRALLEEAARKAIEAERPGFTIGQLDLVLVDDRPGVTEDKAHLLASGADERLRVVLARRDGGWIVERVDAE